jgi:CRP-like cAMP-binding protein
VSFENAEAFPILSAADFALVEQHGARRSIAVGDYLLHQSDQSNEFYVVLSGAVEIVVHADGTDRVITRHGPGLRRRAQPGHWPAPVRLGARGRTR